MRNWTATLAGAVLVFASALALAPDRLWLGCALGWTLLALSIIDLKQGILPDRLTLPLLAGGLIASAVDGPFDAPVSQSLIDHGLGAATGLALLAVPALAYRHLRGHDGMGWGDVKLAGACGAWLGWEAVPLMIWIAAVLGIALFLARRLIHRTRLSASLPFGPALAGATWGLWLCGPIDGILDLWMNGPAP